MSDDLVKRFDRKGAFATYNLIDALSRNPTTIYAGADICAEAKSTILVQADRIEELEAKLAKAVGALESVMVGGNHLALLLPDNFLPAETEPLDALDMMGAGDAYEAWCCWRSIMLARTTLAELTKGKDG